MGSAISSCNPLFGMLVDLTINRAFKFEELQYSISGDFVNKIFNSINKILLKTT
jgi:hypothetical protein